MLHSGGKQQEVAGISSFSFTEQLDITGKDKHGIGFTVMFYSKHYCNVYCLSNAIIHFMCHEMVVSEVFNLIQDFPHACLSYTLYNTVYKHVL